MINLHFIDDVYPIIGNEPYKERQIARGFLLDENNKLSILKISRDDMFGKLTYIESSGGGIDDGENMNDAIKREIREETGYESEIISYIGIVTDHYNLLKRKNIQHYFLLKKGKYVGKHLVSLGDNFINEVSFMSLDDLYKEYSFFLDKKDISYLVARKEMPVLNEIKKILYIRC